MPMVMAICLAPFLAESPRYLVRHPRRWPELVMILRRIGHNIAPNAAFTDSRDTSSSRASFATLLGPELRHDTIAVSLAFLASLLAVYTGFSWIPAMLTAAGLGATVASAGITVFNLGGVVGAVLGALVTRRDRDHDADLAAGAVGAAVATVR
jgi:AAHS family 4-hydroxybenzoate transporter-like MFS transporter